MTAESGGRAAVGEISVAAGVFALAALIIYGTWIIPPAPIFARVGPTLFPYLCAGGLVLMGAFLLVEALRGGWRDTSDDVPTDWRGMSWLGLGLTLNVALISSIGFVVGSGLMFVCIARAFRSREILRDTAIGLGVCLLAYIGFRWFLGVNIGAGIVEEWIDAVMARFG